jgi:hypothetical protein
MLLSAVTPLQACGAVPSQRQFYGNLPGCLCEFAAFGNYIVGFGGDNFSGNRTIDHVTDIFGHSKNVTTGFQGRRRVCRNTTDYPEVVGSGDLWGPGRVDRKRQGGCPCAM